MKRRSMVTAALLAVTALAAASVSILGRSGDTGASQVAPDLSFKLVRSAADVAANCMRDASANVAVTKLGRAEQLVIHAHGLVPTPGSASSCSRFPTHLSASRYTRATSRRAPTGRPT